MIRRRSDVPLESDGSGRFLPWIIAFMVYLATLALAASMVLGSAAARWSAGLSGTLTVQLLPLGEASEVPAARLTKAVEVLQATPGVTGVRVLSAAETRTLVEPWLGPGPEDGKNDVLSALPLPRLIDVTVAPDANIDTAALGRRLEKVTPGAVVDDHREWLADLLILIGSVEWLAAGVVAFTALAAVLSVVFTAKAGLAAHEHVIELLHLIGARDLYVARQFERHALRLGLRGGLIGVTLAVLTIYLLDLAAGGIGAGLLPELALTSAQWAALVAPLVAAAAIARFTARVTVLRRLSRMM